MQNLSSLRQILRVDAGVCGGIVALLLAAPGAVVDVLDAGSTTTMRILGVVLLAYAALLGVAASASSERVVRTAVVESAVADALWVAGTVGLVVTGTIAAVGLLAAPPVVAIGLAKAQRLGIAPRRVPAPA